MRLFDWGGLAKGRGKSDFSLSDFFLFFFFPSTLFSLFFPELSTRAFKPFRPTFYAFHLPSLSTKDPNHVPPRLSGRRGSCSRGPELAVLLDARCLLGFFFFFGLRLGGVSFVVVGAHVPGLGTLVLAAPALVRL